MPGRNPHQAKQAFLEPLHRCLSCISLAQFYVRTGRPGDQETLALSQYPLPLQAAAIGRIHLVLSHWFRTVADESGDWHVSTIGYEYRLTSEEGQELIAWHWHPAPLPGPDYPHLHVGSELLSHKAHLPTGRVSIESVLRLLMQDLGVPARRDDWADVLDTAERAFIEHRRWHARSPDDG